MTSEDRLGGSLDVLLGLFLALPGAEHEYGQAAAQFLRSDTPDLDAAPDALDSARRRFHEWFLLERPSELLTEPPIVALREPFLAAFDDTEFAASAYACLVDSRAGFFEVRDVEPGTGVWLHDVLGHGAFPVREPHASNELAAGDLAVGRIFGVGDGEFAMSPAVAVFRREGLVEALRGDAERLRAARRGALRMSQFELEVMFFKGEQATPEAPEEVEQRALSLLEAAGWDAEERADVRAALTTAAAGNPELATTAIAAVLERVAFECEIDLDELRRELALWWESLRERANPAPKITSFQTFGGASDRQVDRTPSTSVDARTALAEFDRGRSEGRDLGELFERLERDLGIEDAREDDPGVAPDFPGVVGAMVEEFLWESEHEKPGSTREFAEYLRCFAEANKELGIFEELEAIALVEFATRTATERELYGEEPTVGARTLLDGLKAFALWADSEHDLGLWPMFERVHAGLVRELPRTASISLGLARPVGLDWSPVDWGRVEDGGSTVEYRGDRLRLELSPGVVPANAGDWIVGRARGGVFAAAAVLPPEAGRLRQ